MSAIRGREEGAVQTQKGCGMVEASVNLWRSQEVEYEVQHHEVDLAFGQSRLFSDVGVDRLDLDARFLCLAIQHREVLVRVIDGVHHTAVRGDHPCNWQCKPSLAATQVSRRLDDREV
jgi:hypothetical protein